MLYQLYMVVITSPTKVAIHLIQSNEEKKKEEKKK